MSLPIYVDAYAGYKPTERPQQFTLDEEIYEIDAVLDQWYEPSATYFKCRALKERRTCFDTINGRTSERYRVAWRSAGNSNIVSCFLFMGCWVND